MRKLYSLTLAFFAGMAINAMAVEPTDVHVYINPGHGGHDSDDRNVVIYPFEQGDPEGYWESNSNLDKGLQLRDLLEEAGIKVTMSRTTNTSEDDLNLTTIGTLANESGADIFFSIHSNATGTGNRVNYPIGLYRGYTGQPEVENSDYLAECLLPQLMSNEATVWTNEGRNYGDWTFYPSWGTQGLGVLRVTAIPAMLSEGSFHDYVPETYRLMNWDFCWLEAWHFKQAVLTYFDLPGETIGHICGIVHDSRTERTEDYLKYDRDVLEPMCGAEVTLKNSSGEVVDTYTTDELFNGFYLFKNVEPGDYKISVKAAEHYDAEISVNVAANTVSYGDVAMNRIRNTPPEVVEYSPVWNEGDESLLCNTPIVLKFNWDMDTESTEAAFSIEPAVEGTITWEDSNYQMTFVPNEPYATNTLYTVTLSTGACHGGGTPMEEAVSFSFRTDARRFLQLISTFPADGGKIHYDGPAIEIRTDSVMNCTNIRDLVSIKDAAGNAVAFNNRTMSYGKAGSSYGFMKISLSKDLNPGENYTMNLSRNISDLDGISLENDIVVNFTASDESKGNEYASMVDECEDAATLVLDESESANYESATISTSSTHLFGSRSLNAKYKFTGEEGGVLTYKFANPFKAGELLGYDTFGIYVNGDFCTHGLYALFEDGETVEEVKICDIDFHGWMYKQFVAPEMSGDTRYSFVGLRIKQNPGKIGMSCDIKFDNITYEKDGSGISKVEISGLKVYPNPASEYIITSADSLITGLTLIGQDGRVISQSSYNVLNVSEVPSGTYILVVDADKMHAVKKIIISH